jgi:hypothetical protein
MGRGWTEEKQIGVALQRERSAGRGGVGGRGTGKREGGKQRVGRVVQEKQAGVKDWNAEGTWGKRKS